MAIFVEGATEQVFVAKLVREVAGENRVQVLAYKAEGGAQSARRYVLIDGVATDTGRPYLVRVINCGTDNRVKSDLTDNYLSLTASGYTSILGVRDVRRDFTRADIPALRKGLMHRVRTAPVSPSFFLGVMEVESWFLSEPEHFARVHSNLTRSNVCAAVGFDPWVIDPQSRDHPSDDLDIAYKTVGFRYKKKRNHIERTVDALDYAAIYCSDRGIPDLDALVKALGDFFIS